MYINMYINVHIYNVHNYIHCSLHSIDSTKLEGDNMCNSIKSGKFLADAEQY